MTHLLDTSALLAHYLAEPGAERVQSLLEDDAVVLGVSILALYEFELRLQVDKVGSTSVGWSWSVVCDEATCIEGRHTTVHVGEDGAPEPVRPELRILLADPAS